LAKFDLAIGLIEQRRSDGTPLGLAGGIGIHRADLFERRTIEGLAAKLMKVLKSVATDPTERIAASRCSRPMRNDNPARWNATDRAFPNADWTFFETSSRPPA